MESDLRAAALGDMRFVVAEVDSEGLGNRLPSERP